MNDTYSWTRKGYYYNIVLCTWVSKKYWITHLIYLINHVLSIFVIRIITIASPDSAAESVPTPMLVENFSWVENKNPDSRTIFSKILREIQYRYYIMIFSIKYKKMKIILWIFKNDWWLTPKTVNKNNIIILILYYWQTMTCGNSQLKMSNKTCMY